MKTKEIYVAIGDTELTKKEFENGCGGIEFWAADKSYYPPKRMKNFYSAKSLAEYLLQNPEANIRSGWTNESISKEKIHKIIQTYHMLYD